MSGPYQGRDLSNCGVGRLRVAINCGVLSVNVFNIVLKQESFNLLFLTIASSLQELCYTGAKHY